MDNQNHEEIHPSQELHPEIAFQIGEQVNKKRYDVHPSLQGEVEGSEPEPLIEAAPDAVEEHVHEDAPEPVVDTPSTTESSKDRDWHQMRAKAEEAKKYKYELELRDREIAFYRDQASRAQVSQPVVIEDDYRTDTEKALQHKMEQLERQVAEQQKVASEAQRQSAISRAEQRLAQDYPDIRNVVSDENIRRLEAEYPTLYNSVIASTDVYTVGSAAYEMIVAKGIYKKPGNALNQLASSNTIAKNQAKPRSVSTVAPGESPIKRASTYMTNSISSDEEAKALYAEMVASSRNRN